MKKMSVCSRTTGTSRATATSLSTSRATAEEESFRLGSLSCSSTTGEGGAGGEAIEKKKVSIGGTIGASDDQAHVAKPKKLAAFAAAFKADPIFEARLQREAAEEGAPDFVLPTTRYVRYLRYIHCVRYIRYIRYIRCIRYICCIRYIRYQARRTSCSRRRAVRRVRRAAAAGWRGGF